MMHFMPHRNSLMKPMQDDGFGNLIDIKHFAAQMCAIYFISDSISWFTRPCDLSVNGLINLQHCSRYIIFTE